MKNAKNVMCITGGPGMGKTEVALEFAHRNSHRYKMVIWVSGECQYLRQNLLNLSLDLELDVSADVEKERVRIRSFGEQETESFKKIKTELFRDIPYLLIIDNLETEKEWWERKDLRDLIQRNTGSPNAITLMTTRRKKEYPSQEIEILKKFYETLGGSSFGLLWVVGSLLCEAAILPYVLFRAINEILVEQSSSHFDELFWENNRFLLKVLIFCMNVLDEIKNRLPLRMLLTCVWFAPSLLSANLLAVAAAANHMSPATNIVKKGIKNANLTFFYYSGFVDSRSWKKEQDSALVLVKLGLARRSNRQPGCRIVFHPITQALARRKGGLLAAQATIQSIRRVGNPILNSDHLWASAFLVFGFKSTPPLVQLAPFETVEFIKTKALPLAVHAFTTFSRCNSALELLKICTSALEEVEKSFAARIEDWCHGSLCWKKKQKSNLNPRMDEYVWQDTTLLKATVLETRAKLLM